MIIPDPDPEPEHVMIPFDPRMVNLPSSESNPCLKANSSSSIGSFDAAIRRRKNGL